jgi:hypothetical protein
MIEGSLPRDRILWRIEQSMNIEPGDYYWAALERFKQSQDFYRRDSKEILSTNHHSLAFYTCGVAVECMLRAFITLKTKEFEGRHDLDLLLVQSGLLDLNPPSTLGDDELTRMKIEIGGAVGKVNRLWSNNLRYASESRLRTYLHELGLDRGIKGDALKENLRQLLEASSRIIDRGAELWKAIRN